MFKRSRSESVYLLHLCRVCSIVIPTWSKGPDLYIICTVDNNYLWRFMQ